MRATLLWLAFASVFMATNPALAQTCAALVDATYAAASLECGEVAPGTICVAGGPVSLTSPDEGEEDNVQNIQTIESGAFVPDSGEWGLAVLSIEANLPNQVVTMVVLGDVSLQNVSQADAPVRVANLRVAESTGLNVRAAPDENAERVGLLLFGQIVPATGRLEQVEWLRVALPDGASGWVSALSVLPEGEVDALPVVSVEDAPPESPYSPMQALSFRSGVEDAPCRSAPDSGILLQTTQPVNMQINGAELRFDGTVFVQADRGMTAHVLESQAEVTSTGVTETASAGSKIRIPYDTEEKRLAAPRAPEPYSYARLRPLPFRLLPRPVDDLPFNLLGIVTPAVPDQPPLEGITSTDACAVAAVNEVRLRQGPGRDYPIVGALFADQSAHPDGRAQGLDNVLWWRLSEGMWVRSDVVLAAGACGDLPVIGIPPLIGEIGD